MKLVPKSPAGGADITEIDLRDQLPAMTITAVKDAFHTFGVIAFRDQDISPEDQFRFCELMGGTATRGQPLDRRREQADAEYDGAVHLVTNLTKDGKPLGSFGDGEVWFHHDGSFKEIPYAATVLYGLTVTSRGGETVFANMYMAYDRLSDDVKHRLDGLFGLNIYDYAAREPVDLDRDTSNVNQWVHPLVIRHPVTGRKALYVSPLITARIEGLPKQESNDLLQELFRYIHDDEIKFQHRWSAGDLVMMDNRCITHARLDFPENEERMLRRTMVEGVPIGA